MSSPKTIHALNRLLTLHSRSLPMYLASATPWYGLREAPAAAALRHVAEDQQLMADRIGAIVIDEGGAPQPGDFPMEYTDLHDLALDYLLPIVRKQQQQDLETIRSLIDQLQSVPAARAIAEEALGAAQAHLDSLAEVSSAAHAS